MSQLSKGPVDAAARRRQEDHEAFLHACPLEANLQRAQTTETPSTRECEKSTHARTNNMS
jgi:hypothetical protein